MIEFEGIEGGIGHARYSNPDADAIIGRKIPILDHGYAYLVDYLGGDGAIADAARTSFGRGTRKRSDDEALIRRLMRDRHTSPFEMVEFVIQFRAPIFVLRQLFRHRTHSANEESMRYSQASDEFYTPAPEHVRLQSRTSKQGGDEIAPASVGEWFGTASRHVVLGAATVYVAATGEGIARELARINLPVSAYSTVRWKMNLHNLLHLLSLRLDPHAQWETRQYAEAFALIVSRVTPFTYAMWQEYVFEGVRLSATAAQVVRDVLRDTNARDDHELSARLMAIESESERADFRKKFGL